MSKKVRILGIQISPKLEDKQYNLDKAKSFIQEYSWYKPDLIILPEVFNVGIAHDAFQQTSETVPGGETSKLLSSLAVKYKTNIIAGSFIEKISDEQFGNACVMFDRNGQCISKYHKTHMFSYFGSCEGKYITPGEELVVTQTDVGKIGLSICYDLRFPELFRALTFSGAEIIICPAAWPQTRLEHWITLSKARAIENQVYFIPINQAGVIDNGRLNAGNSMVINPWGEIVASMGMEEGILKTEIDLDEVHRIRESFPVLQDKKDSVYKNISIK